MLKNIQEMAKEFKNVDEVKKELKNIQSKKCRLKKQKARKDYESKMNKILEYEQTIKEVKDYFEPKTKPVTEFTKQDLENLDYDQTIKALKSIQSKKSNTRYLSDSSEYKKALKIEKLLLEHKKQVKPIDQTTVRKTEIENIINEVENLENISKDKILEYLENLKNK